MTFVAAFDVDERKVGADLAKAVQTGNAATTFLDIGHQNVTVSPGMLLDGLEGNLKGQVTPDPATYDVGPAEVIEVLRESEAEVLVCFLPTGATHAVRSYAEAAARAGVAFVNGTPEQVANDPGFQALFAEHNAQLVGDDTRSMVGATTVHTALIELLRAKGVTTTGTYQINVGGNMDFLNLADADRSASKVASKRNALSAAGIDASTVLAGPNGFVGYLGDTKICHLSLEGESILGSRIKIDLRLEVEDSPNAAGTMIDAVRVVAGARRAGQVGLIAPPCEMLFKSPPTPAAHSEAMANFDAFVADLDRQLSRQVDQ
ncbi:inositol-3-phosphate synthase [Kribbella sp. NPDC056345]|uniref:inositol-3-phosphate synthase n=1 Tax=Kribbella sp. NPDC056345 TaxID=3345789 RepID=UPI0035DE88EE